MTRTDAIPCPPRAVLWERKGLFAAGSAVQTGVLVRRVAGAAYCAEVDDETPFLVELREGPAPVPGEGVLGPLLEMRDLDGETVERVDVEPVLFGEAPDEVLLVAELSLEAGGWDVGLVTNGIRRKHAKQSDAARA